MIKKFVGIANISRFLSFGATGDIQMSKITVIFGENGKGKTTLTSILRSLQSGESEIVFSRKRLPQTGEPSAKVLLDSGMVEFKGGTWSKTYPEIEIFDEHFIDQNVCSGLSIEHEHKRNLYRVIVGEQGVLLTRKVEEIDVQIREVNALLKDKSNELKQFVKENFDVDKFVALPRSDAIEKLIAIKESEIKALQGAGEVQAKGELHELRLVNAPSTAFLSKTLDELSKEAAEAVAAHTKRLDKSGEQWLERGVAYLGETCPFCAQSVKNVDLVSAYRAYFSAAYKAFKSDIGNHQKATTDNFGPNAVIAVQETFKNNSTLVEFWKQYFDVQLGILDLADIIQAIRNIERELGGALQQKSSSPLDPITPSEQLDSVITEYKQLCSSVEDYNNSCRKTNDNIKEVKARAKGSNLAAAKKDLSGLHNIKARRTQDIDDLCKAYLVQQLNKLNLEQEKVRAKETLDAYSDTIFGLYESSMNDHLAMFGADFRLVNTGGNYQGGKPNSTYSIAINSCPVTVDGRGGEPSFKTTLSGGDKSCLALAFFLSRIDHDPKLSEKVVVLDDPMCSMDHDRSDRTVKVLLDLVAKAKQVVLLSHDNHFLRRVWNGSPQDNRKAIHVRRIRDNESTIEEWDIINATRSEYLQDYFALVEYLQAGGGDLRDLARKIRVLLEENLRMRFPDAFGSTEWLGDFLEKIRNADSGDAVFAMKSQLNEIEALNDFSKKYHHGNPAASREPVTDGALKTYAQRTLVFLRGQP